MQNRFRPLRSRDCGSQGPAADDAADARWTRHNCLRHRWPLAARTLNVPNAVMFDLDRVLVDSEPLWNQALAAWPGLVVELVSHRAEPRA